MRRHEIPGVLVRRRPPVVEDTTSSRKDSTSADREEISHARKLLDNIVVHIGHGSVSSSGAAGHNEDVKVQIVIKGGFSDDDRLVRRVEAVAQGRRDDDILIRRRDNCHFEVLVGCHEIQQPQRSIYVEQIDSGKS